MNEPEMSELDENFFNFNTERHEPVTMDEGLGWLEHLRDDPGFNWIMRKYQCRAMESVRRWISHDITEGERESRNSAMKHAQAVFGLVRLLDGEIEAAKKLMGLPKKEGEHEDGSASGQHPD